ncbi:MULTISPECIES: hypothetical protein [Cytobacillus]|uniref:hypothetical protein n=1 Tax=Cytobacillus TaxID=2675230 RepID=UPI00203CB89F|nr:hypothetical protein [Cytobacillus firmus]MCM3706269.1 hypothetical protein [Cytobacillus firmus]
MGYTVLEKFTHAKSGREEDNEDRIVTVPGFAAVIDGMTPQDKTLYSGVSPALICTGLLSGCIARFSPDIKYHEAVTALTDCIGDYYREHEILEEVTVHPHKRMGANMVIYSHHRKEIWFVGDCQCSIDGMIVKNEKLVDRLMTDMRVTILRSYLETKETEELFQKDMSTLHIQPFLKQQYIYQNNQEDSPLAYTVIDGFPVIMNQVKVVDVEHAADLILASDGYPVIKENLADTEAALAHLLQNDPLCYFIHPNTKGLEKGKDSFDDRSFLRMKV